MTSAVSRDRRGGVRRALRWMGRVHADHRYGVLFYTLLGTLAASPLLTVLGFSTDLLQIFLAFSLLVALLGVPGQRWRVLLMLLAAVSVGMRVAPLSAVSPRFATGALAAASVLALVAAASAIRFAMRARAIDAEHLYAALSAYVLAGMFFGLLHWAAEVAWPGSFAEAGAPLASFPLSSAIYFSFVTLATLGYGDVVPRTELTRGLAVLEAVGGQLYVAVMIARLVGAQLLTAAPGGQTGADEGGQRGGGAEDRAARQDRPPHARS